MKHPFPLSFTSIGAAVLIAVAALLLSHRERMTHAAPVVAADRGGTAEAGELVEHNDASRAVAPVRAPAEAQARAPEATTRAQLRTARAAPRSSDRLPAEARWLAGDDVSAASVSELLRSGQGFDAAIDALAIDMAVDAEAEALMDAYSEVIETQLPETGTVRLERLACGLRLCLARFEETARGDWNAWRRSFDADTRTPHHVFIEREVDLGDGVTERRVLFATDPGSSGIVVPVFAGG